MHRVLHFYWWGFIVVEHHEILVFGFCVVSVFDRQALASVALRPAPCPCESCFQHLPGISQLCAQASQRRIVQPWWSVWLCVRSIAQTARDVGLFAFVCQLCSTSASAVVLAQDGDSWAGPGSTGSQVKREGVPIQALGFQLSSPCQRTLRFNASCAIKQKTETHPGVGLSALLCALTE